MVCFGSLIIQWGDIPFHYGRWVMVPGRGWLWAPDYEWGPAWVFWRHAEADGAIGWAPLPVGAVFVGEGFMFTGSGWALILILAWAKAVSSLWVTITSMKGSSECAAREWAWHIHGDRFHAFYRRSVLRNGFAGMSKGVL